MGGRESSEDYLEAILVIRRLRGSCRNVDIAERMGVAKPSVTKALGNLARRGLAEGVGRVRGLLQTFRGLSREPTRRGRWRVNGGRLAGQTGRLAQFRIPPTRQLLAERGDDIERRRWQRASRHRRQAPRRRGAASAAPEGADAWQSNQQDARTSRSPCRYRTRTRWRR
ncbi:metal-dependent transcriptional regulator [Raoultibacter massiliensis]|uniref:metal-dependent transcriptional regulator n=1 Tax=Raoultibacter massiliensis TaxID=1852371 RepID=UPI001FE342DB|nr:hypothetical protein [Raoultibacter massiliensis]